jgi:hypothetical protein
MTGRDRRARRGSYNAMVGALLPLVIGFAALSVDMSWVRLADGQSQDVADAASHAALIELRATGNTANARLAAERIIDENIVGGGPGTMGDIQFGEWRRGSVGLSPTSLRPNAVQVEVGRYGDDPVGLNFARIWGRDSAVVSSDATAATRSLQVVLVMDITGSFRSEISEARKAAVRFLDILSDVHGREDMVGMAVYLNRYSWAYSEMFLLSDLSARTLARSQWNKLDVGSQSEQGCYSQRDYRNDPAKLLEPRSHDYTNGGTKPDLPRWYCDENGTDHHVGIAMGRQLIQELDDPLAYRAMVVLTDGQPNNLERSPLSTMEGYESYDTLRDYLGYTEPRFREYRGPLPHNVAQIEDATVAEAGAALAEDEIHTWMVSFRATAAYLKDVPGGDGRFYYTDNAAELTPIFEDIANSLPLMIVK